MRTYDKGVGYPRGGFSSHDHSLYWTEKEREKEKSFRQTSDPALYQSFFDLFLIVIR